MCFCVVQSSFCRETKRFFQNKSIILIGCRRHSGEDSNLARKKTQKSTPWNENWGGRVQLISWPCALGFCFHSGKPRPPELSQNDKGHWEALKNHEKHKNMTVGTWCRVAGISPEI